MKRSILFILIGLIIWISASSQGPGLRSGSLQIAWSRKGDGWHINKISTDGHSLSHPAGYYTILYSSGQPVEELVKRNQFGEAFTFYPDTAIPSGDSGVDFSQRLPVADIEASWKTDPLSSTDIRVEIRLRVKSDGYFSIASPTIAVIDRQDLAWGMVPGNWYGREIQKDLQLAGKYSQGLPAIPLMATERSTMTLCPLLTTREGVTLAVIPDPNTAEDPWAYDRSSRNITRLGMSTMDRHYALTPVAFSPVLGHAGSYAKAGETLVFRFRYTIRASGWFPVFRHAVEDVYHFSDMLKVQQPVVSLTERMRLIQSFLQDDSNAHWNTWESGGLTIGANGTKNADIGAMWMLANNCRDSTMRRHIPFVRNYKLAQQQMGPGFFQYAATGEYGGKNGFNSEVGNWVEPLFTTYYTLVDLGNMLLFQPGDKELRTRMRLAAEKMLSWQHADGSWDVGYDRFSHRLTFPGLLDLRPTWYGLLAAYRVLGDPRYLRSAQKGADWLITRGVNKGYYLGVCGDAQNIWDFATAQSAQAFLDLYEITKKGTYKQAAIEAAKVYATSIYTYPAAGTAIKLVNGARRQDWEISQAGLGVEHPQGSAPEAGPILITSFTGLFVRVYELTHESLFLDMARAAARGRHAFMDSVSGQTVYYWQDMVRVRERVMEFPHQGYWSIGWITDYLLSEIRLRSKDSIEFPHGFMTPKVGPHVAYGFAAGTLYGEKARLWMPPGLFHCGNPSLECVTALSENAKKLYVMVLNQSPGRQTGAVAIDLDKIIPGHAEKKIHLELAGWGLDMITIDL
jgi:hypothetical protein